MWWICFSLHFFLSLEKKNDELSFSSRREKEKKKKGKRKKVKQFLNDRGQMKIENSHLVPLFHPFGGRGRWFSFILHPFLRLISFPLFVLPCLFCCVCVLVAKKRSAEAMAAMVALSPGVLAPSSRNTLHFGPTFRSSKLLCTGQARWHRRVMSFFSSLSFLSFISLSLPPLLFYIGVQFVRACVCVFFFFFLISFSVFREKGRFFF